MFHIHKFTRKLSVLSCGNTDGISKGYDYIGKPLNYSESSQKILAVTKAEAKNKKYCALTEAIGNSKYNAILQVLGTATVPVALFLI